MDNKIYYLNNIKVIFQGSVYMYYGLTNYYQNHRRYVKSRDDNQLLGHLELTPSNDCNPYQIDKKTQKPYAPCGAIANSLFNGNYYLYLILVCF